MATFFLARHGETIWHAENRYTGSSDIGLTGCGRQQAQALGVWANRANLSQLVSSDLSRSVETAKPAQRQTGLDLRIEPALREVDFGRGEGMTRAEMRKLFPDRLQAFLEAPGEVPLPGGEPGTLAIRRAAGALNSMARDASADARILVVMHSTLMRLLMCHFLGIGINQYRTVFTHVQNAALTELRAAPAGTSVLWQLAGFNVPPG